MDVLSTHSNVLGYAGVTLLCVLVLEHIGLVYNRHRPSQSIDWFATQLRWLFTFVSVQFARLSAFLEWFHLERLAESIGALCTSTFRLLTSWLWLLVGYGEYVAASATPVVIWSGSAILIVVVGYFFSRLPIVDEWTHRLFDFAVNHFVVCSAVILLGLFAFALAWNVNVVSLCLPKLYAVFTGDLLMFFAICSPLIMLWIMAWYSDRFTDFVHHLHHVSNESITED